MIQSHQKLVGQLYHHCLMSVDKLNHAITVFTQSVNDKNYQAIKVQWKKSKRCYSMAEATRFSGAYIDEIDTLINAWPIDELYIDYVSSNPRSGIIGNTQIEITPANLLTLNERQGETNISIGYHAIEFLLWGQDLNINGPGDRSWTDYSVAPDAERRKKYLTTAGQLLQEHIKALTHNWQNNLETKNFDQLITGLGTFIKAELIGERMQVALDTYDQEDEQSCFSDQTNYDIIYNIIGVKALLEGSLVFENKDVVFDGYGLIELFRHKDPEMSEQMLDHINQALKLMQNVGLPFDQAILPANPQQRKTIEEVASLMSMVAKNLRILQYKNHAN